MINISLPPELVKAMDEAAKAVYATRSEYIRQAVVARLQVDEQLDDEAAVRAGRRKLKKYLDSIRGGLSELQ